MIRNIRTASPKKSATSSAQWKTAVNRRDWSTSKKRTLGRFTEYNLCYLVSAFASSQLVLSQRQVFVWYLPTRKQVRCDFSCLLKSMWIRQFNYINAARFLWRWTVLLCWTAMQCHASRALYVWRRCIMIMFASAFVRVILCKHLKQRRCIRFWKQLFAINIVCASAADQLWLMMILLHILITTLRRR